VRVAGSRQQLQVRADDQGTVTKLDEYLKQYKEFSYKIPPVVTATTLPVLTLSVLSKTLTGHGLPGSFLGTVEGLSYLLFIAGAGSLLPRLSAIIAGGDYSVDEMINVLTAEDDGAMGDSATSRVMNAKVAKGSALAEQQADLIKRQQEKATETPEQKAAREALRAQLASAALGNAEKTQDSYNAEKGTDDKLLGQSATKTISECMTNENYEKDISQFSDDDLNDNINLSKSEIDSKAPEVVGKGDDWRMKNFKEAEAREAKAKKAAEEKAE